MNPISRGVALVSRRVALASLTLWLAACSEHGVPKKQVGDAVPLSRNRILQPGEDWRNVTTMDTRVRLYRWRIADLVEQKKPFIVVFGTPQHCTICVDQLSRVALVEEKYGERFAFVHVDGYKDNAVWVDWGIKGEPWTFVVDTGGRVRRVFPGQTEVSLLEDQVRALLGEAAGVRPIRAAIALLAAAGAGPALASYGSGYTYVKMSLGVPWALYFVFLGAVLIPFVIMFGRGAMDRFLRYVLPVLVVGVLAIVAVFVLNAFEVTHLMETEKRAGPTLLSR